MVLTRALSDFAKMVEIFDARGVSFVSVTQQFNTTTSMGRLTLNVLLSFAQFEREVTGERIRDKIAASKKKGLWMGGHVPLGYEARDRTLVINPVEARTIRSIFRLYLEHGCVNKLKAAADTAGLRSRLRTRLDGTTTGGGSFSRGHLYAILQNPIYIGRIAHKGQTYPGAHEAIIDMKTWDAVQAGLAANRKARRSGTNAKEPSLLAGLLFDANGQPLTPSHAVKNGKRYRYYVSRHLVVGESSTGRGWRIPAGQIETAVLEALRKFFAERRWLEASGEGIPIDTLRCAFAKTDELALSLKTEPNPSLWPRLLELIEKISFDETVLRIVLNRTGIAIALGIEGRDEGEPIVIEAGVTWKRRGVEAKLIIAAGSGQETAALPDPALIKSIVRAHDWWTRLASGEAASLNDIARADGVTGPYVRRLLPLAFLAPDIIETILGGGQPINLTAEKLLRIDTLPYDWDDQRRILGFA